MWRRYGDYAACGIGVTMPRPGLCREDLNGALQGPQNMALRADVPFNMRHSPGTVNQVNFREGHLGAS
jgi:hypothetical protein